MFTDLEGNTFSTKEEARDSVEAHLRRLEAVVVTTELAERTAVQAANEARAALKDVIERASDRGYRLLRFDYEANLRKSRS